MNDLVDSDTRTSEAPADSADLARYARQMRLPGFGDAGQRRLRAAHVAIVGCGGLGSHAAEQLARAGVGRLTLIDRDLVEWSNLQRQVLYDEADAEAARPKAVAAAEKLGRINHEVELTPIVADVTGRDVIELLGDCDLWLDGLDNFETRFVLNDAAVAGGRPWIYTGAIATRAMVAPMLPATALGDAPWERDGAGGATPCLRCLLDQPPPPGATPTCDTAGVLGVTVAIAAMLQVAEALRMLTGDWAGVTRGVIHQTLSPPRMRLSHYAEGPAGDCPCCARREFPWLEDSARQPAELLCGRQAVQVRPQQPARLDLAEVADRWAGCGEVLVNRFMARLTPHDDSHPPPAAPPGTAPGSDPAISGSPAPPGGSPVRLSLFADGRAIVEGVRDPVRARSLYARYVGM